jgi:hypothetical protein
MKQVDMSAKAVTARLRLVSQLRRLGLSLQKTKLPAEATSKTTKRQHSEPSPSAKQKTK